MHLEKFYDKAFVWILNVGPKLIVAIILFILGQWVLRHIRKFTAAAMRRKNLAPALQPLVLNFIFTALQVLLIFATMQVVGLQMTIFTTLIGAFGVAAGLALSGTLQNFTSGIMILFFKPFRTGDNIIAQGMEGTVINIEIFHTVVKSYDNKIIIIPNSKLSNDIIINLSREGRRRLDIEIKVPFSVNFSDVESIIKQAASRVDALLKEPQVRTGISSIENDGYKVQVNSWLPAHGFHDAKLAFQIKLVDALKHSGIKLPGM